MSEEQKQLEQAKETLKEAAINSAASDVEHRYALDQYKILVNKIMGVPPDLTQPKESQTQAPAPVQPPPSVPDSKEKEPEEKVDQAIDEIKDKEVEVSGSSKDFNIDEAVEKMMDMTDDQRLKFTHGDGRKGISHHMRVKWDLEVVDIDHDADSEEEEEKEEQKETQAPPPPSKPEAPKPPEKPSAPSPPPAPAKPETKPDESPKAPAEEKTEEKPASGSLKVDLPEGIVRPEGSPECFGNAEVYDETSKKCMTCIYDFECKEALEEMAK